MKIQHLFSLLTVSGVTIATTFFPQAPSHSQGVQFVCASNNGNPATVARHPKHGDVPIINWVSDHFNDSGYTPQQRCEQVSKRFQKHHSKGLLNYLTTGKMNNQNIVCVAESDTSGCVGLLFTLKPGSNPSSTLQRLMNVRAQAGGPLNETGDRVYIDMDKYMEDKASAQAPQESEVSPGTPSSVTEENSNDGGLW